MSFFLGSKKRDLSDMSRKGKDAKKVRENAESTGIHQNILTEKKTKV